MTGLRPFGPYLSLEAKTLKVWRVIDGIVNHVPSPVPRKFCENPLNKRIVCIANKVNDIHLELISTGEVVQRHLGTIQLKPRTIVSRNSEQTSCVMLSKAFQAR